MFNFIKKHLRIARRREVKLLMNKVVADLEVMAQVFSDSLLSDSDIENKKSKLSGMGAGIYKDLTHLAQLTKDKGVVPLFDPLEFTRIDTVLAIVRNRLSGTVYSDNLLANAVVSYFDDRILVNRGTHLYLTKLCEKEMERKSKLAKELEGQKVVLNRILIQAVDLKNRSARFLSKLNYGNIKDQNPTFELGWLANYTNEILDSYANRPFMYITDWDPKSIQSLFDIGGKLKTKDQELNDLKDRLDDSFHAHIVNMVTIGRILAENLYPVEILEKVTAIDIRHDLASQTMSIVKCEPIRVNVSDIALSISADVSNLIANGKLEEAREKNAKLVDYLKDNKPRLSQEVLSDLSYKTLYYLTLIKGNANDQSS